MSDGGRVARALFRVDASRGELQRFRQSLAITAIPAPRFSGSRAPARSFIRHQIVEIFCDLDTVSVGFIGSSLHGFSLANAAQIQARVSTTS